MWSLPPHSYNTSNMKRCVLHLASIVVIVASTGCDKFPEEQKVVSEQIMGTTITVTSVEGADAVFDIFREVDATMSEWKADSPLARVNNAAGDRAVRVPVDLFATVERSLQIAELTSGAFDPTWATLWHLWKFDGSNNVPSQNQLDSLLPWVNWKGVILNEEDHSIYIPGGKLGLGGIAKGVALDRARDALIAESTTDFMIVAGGQVLVQGLNEGRLWRIGIQTPEKRQNEYMAVLKVTNTCVSTSGDYEKYFEVDGIRYHHLIDPKTGHPARGTRSVTVITPDATLADALSTALFVMDPSRAIGLVNGMRNVEAVIIDEQLVLHLSNNIADKLELFVVIE